MIFDEDSDDGKGNKKASVLLRNVVKVESKEVKRVDVQEDIP